jgi:hypothetical protein
LLIALKRAWRNKNLVACRSSAAQIGFRRCLGSATALHPATALSLSRSSPFCHPERSRVDLRCAIRVPRSFRFTTSTCHPPNPPGKHLSPLCYYWFPGVGRRTADPLGCAPPDLLFRLVALANFMRLSLRERLTGNRVQRSVAGNPGRDDKKERIVARKGRFLN